MGAGSMARPFSFCGSQDKQLDFNHLHEFLADIIGLKILSSGEKLRR